MTNDELRITNVEKLRRVSGFRRFCSSFLILSFIPMFGCGRYLVRNELRLNDYYSEIVKRVDRDWIGDDRFFEDNLLANPDPEVRRWCAIALGRIGSPGALPLLYRAVHTGDAAVRAASASSIGIIEDRDVLARQSLSPDPQATAELKALLDDPSISVRMRAVEALGKTGSRGEAEDVVRQLENFQYGGSAIERACLEFAITALVRLKDPIALPVLERLADAGDSDIQWRALDALVRLHDENAVPLYIRKLLSANSEVQFCAARGLSISGFHATRQLAPLLLPRNSRTGESVPLLVRSGAIQTLGELKDAAAIPSIKAAIEVDPVDQAHPDQQNFAIMAADALGEIGSSHAEPVLVLLLNSVQPVANGAAIALAKTLKGNPARFFSLVDRRLFMAPEALPAWIKAMESLGGDEAEAELQRMLVHELKKPTGSGYEFVPGILRTLARFNPSGLQEIISPFLDSRNPALLRTAIELYQPKKNTKEPWSPIAQVFANCSDSETKINALFHLTPWIQEPKVQQVLLTGLKDHNKEVRLASLSLLQPSGIKSALEDLGPAAPSITDAMARTLAASRKNNTIASIETTRGTLELELFREDAPLTVANFVLMAKGGAYDGFIFKQVLPAQRIGGVDSGSHAGFGRISNGEVNMRPFERGSVGLASSGGKKDIGRFFIALTPQPYLDGIDTCFGRVISGIQVADKIVPGDRILRIHIKETIGTFDRIMY